jgi:hypothetical protein
MYAPNRDKKRNKKKGSPILRFISGKEKEKKNSKRSE